MTHTDPTMPRVLTLAPLIVDDVTFEWCLTPTGTRIARARVQGATVTLDWRDPSRVYGEIRRGACSTVPGPLVGGVDAAARHCIRIARRVDETGAPSLCGSDPR